MQKTVETLLVIQERDQKIRDLNTELQRLPAEEEQANEKRDAKGKAKGGDKKEE